MRGGYPGGDPWGGGGVISAFSPIRNLVKFEVLYNSAFSFISAFSPIRHSVQFGIQSNSAFSLIRHSV